MTNLNFEVEDCKMAAMAIRQIFGITRVLTPQEVDAFAAAIEVIRISSKVEVFCKILDALKANNHATHQRLLLALVDEYKTHTESIELRLTNLLALFPVEKP